MTKYAVHKTNELEVKFNQLLVGDFFLYDNSLFLKTDITSDLELSSNALEMNPIAKVYFFEDDLVLVPSEVIFYQ